MRDQPCFCGCGLNAASSSRSSADITKSARVVTRPQHTRAARSSHAIESSALDLNQERSYQKHLRSRLPAEGDAFKHGSLVQIHVALNKCFRPPCGIGKFSLLLVLLLCSFITTITATAVPAATSSHGNVSSTSIASSPAAAIPTSYQSPGVSGYRQLAAEGVPTQVAATEATNHNIDVQVSQPVMCEPMNITFDPSRGTPPYTVMISFEDYWPVTVSLPASFDDPTKDMWLYQYTMPMFTGETANPSMIVSVTDSTGLMSNSSSFVQAQSPSNGNTCAPFEYSSSFIFYTEQAASQCQDYNIFWNGSYAPPMNAIFLPESAPPIYVAGPSTNANNMSWQVAMSGGTRFVMTMADSRAASGNGGVSKLNIVALNEYVSSSCISQSNYPHRVFAPTTTAPRADVFPDATSTIASLTTNGGQVATVTVIETIKNGRRIHGNGGGLSSLGFLILMIVVLATVGFVGAALGWFCFRRRQKRKSNIRAWDLPSDDPSVPFSADRNMPIAPGVFGRSVTRNDSTAASVHAVGPADRSSVSGVSSHDPVSLSSRPLTRDPSGRNSLRSWTSSAYDHLTTGAQGRHLNAFADDYAMMDTGSREAFSPTDSIPRAFGFYSDDPPTRESAAGHDARFQHRAGSPPLATRATSSDGASTKSNRVGPGPTYRPDAASQAAYQDLMGHNSASPVSGTERTMPFSAAQTQTPGSTVSPTSRTHGWAEVMEGADQSTRIVRHADAGLLLDDNDNGDELMEFGTGRLMELPPQYDTIHPSARSPQRPLQARDQPRDENPFASPPVSAVRAHTHGLDSVDISDTRNRPAEVHAADLVDDNDDESAFWAH